MAKAYGFSAKDAGRIGKTVRAVEAQPRTGAGWWPYVGDEGGGFLLGKTTAAWNKGAAATIDVYTGTPGAETKTGTQDGCINKFADIPAGKWVVVGSINGGWYLVEAEVQTVQVLTGVTLGAAGLVFTTKQVSALSVVAASDVTITTTTCPP